MNKNTNLKAHFIIRLGAQTNRKRKIEPDNIDPTGKLLRSDPAILFEL